MLVDTIEAEMNPEPSALDHHRLTELAAEIGDPVFVRETVGMYLAELPSHRAEMESAFLDGDQQRLGELAHGLRASSEMLGAIELSRVCRMVELAQDSFDTTDRAELFSSWLKSCDRSRIAIEEWLADQG